MNNFGKKQKPRKASSFQKIKKLKKKKENCKFEL